MNICKVSVVIPVYNAEKYLHECLKSLQEQTLRDIEVIMVNDGSTDGTQAICESYSQQDARFVLINQENGGSAAARRTGMLRARGEYIGFLDSDDWAGPEMFEKLYAAASEKNCDIVFCNCFRENGEKQIKCAKQIRDGYYDRSQILSEILPRSLAGLDEKGRNHVIRWANYLRIYRRALIEKYNVYNDPRFRRCQDLQLTFEATLHAQSYYYLGDEYLYHNRVVEGSQSRGYTVNQWQKIRILIEKLYQDVDAFTELDLRAQMDLCTFFFAMYSCENEGREREGLTDEMRRAHLQEICEDPICQGCLDSIPYEKLSKTNQLYHRALKGKNINLIWKANQALECERNNLDRKARILKIPFVLPVYKAIRKIVKGR